MDPEERLELIALLAEGKAWKAVIVVGEALLDAYYPESVFTGESGDIGPRYVVNLREMLKELRKDVETVLSRDDAETDKARSKS
jgi:hypothetical protein